jgi:hypothetical protein
MTYSAWMAIATQIQSLLQAAIGTSSSADYKITDAKMMIRKNPWNVTEETGPGIFIVPVEDTRTLATTRRDDVGYGVGILIFQKTDRNNKSETQLDQLTYWRQKAMDALREIRINSAGVWRVAIEPRIVLDENAFRNQYDMTSFTARCFAREGS